MPRTNFYQETRIIKTARTEEEINKAAKEGFFPLIKEVKPLTEIHSKFAVYQNPKTGEIKVVGDFRSLKGGGFEEVVIDFTSFYPHCFPNPFAAYLIPPDIEIGEVVILEDLIEDLISNRWNQGDVYRLDSCEAHWDGNQFIIHHDESKIVEVLG